ncbi:hypothetical protein GCM10009039_30470 [Halocalculus aciditolerans]|uniref:Uncharacterized protein n=1 Tax=Halocalculus aciditolerans TaxID=1383812 RepID=A0A830FMH3_9EURY|nr:hypothetical protein GCM10009039_30470 [Halocalculus aciditolerans]
MGGDADVVAVRARPGDADVRFDGVGTEESAAAGTNRGAAGGGRRVSLFNRGRTLANP